MDRNDTVQIVIIVVDTSLSARRAWIEILLFLSFMPLKKSLSARRAWIEMSWFLSSVSDSLPSLSARRAWIEISSACSKKIGRLRRSPQGERG